MKKKFRFAAILVVVYTVLFVTGVFSLIYLIKDRFSENIDTKSYPASYNKGSTKEWQVEIWKDIKKDKLLMTLQNPNTDKTTKDKEFGTLAEEMPACILRYVLRKDADQEKPLYKIDKTADENCKSCHSPDKEFKKK